MTRRLQRPTAADVPEETIYERAQVELDKLLEDVRAGYLEAIEFVQQLAESIDAGSYVELERELRASFELVERDAILWEMEAALDAHVDYLVDARRAP